ncbi:hypothetical protein [Actinomadura keratinilytica]|uniref:Uncharacterized protein n=1 Tax=Actinomadura keratinilytica TaxID=547461 RepID=A0ABP7ZBB2_9ACTN
MLSGTLTRRLSTLGAVAALAAVPMAAPADAGTGPPGWRIAERSEEPSDIWLSKVVATGPRDAWAFGSMSSDHGPEPVARRWNGRSWTAVTLPAGLNRGISAADASGPRNVWAIGGSEPAGGEAFALRWDGRRWHVTGRWPAHSTIADVEALGPRDVWLFGDALIGPDSIGTWHFDGENWSQVETPIGHLQEASGVASDDVWAIGGSPVHWQGDLLARWDGRTWNEVSVPGLPREDDHWVTFTDIHAVSSHDVWIVGREIRRSGDDHTYAPFAVHFDGSTWQRITPPSHPGVQGLQTVTSDGRGGIWVKPERWDDEGVELLHYRDGRWTAPRLEHPEGLNARVSDVAAVPRSRLAWAVGGLHVPESGDGYWTIWKNHAPRR